MDNNTVLWKHKLRSTLSESENHVRKMKPQYRATESCGLNARSITVVSEHNYEFLRVKREDGDLSSGRLKKKKTNGECELWL